MPVTVAMLASMRKYPGATDFETIKNRVAPSYAQCDAGDSRIVYPDETAAGTTIPLSCRMLRKRMTPGPMRRLVLFPAL